MGGSAGRKIYKSKNDELKFNWSTPRKRKQMLWARLVSDVVRAIAPQVVKGIYTPEEVADFDKPLKPEKEINPDEAAGMVAQVDKLKTRKAKPSM